MAAEPLSNTPRWLDLSDESLLEGCRLETFRGPGPGGQKRNKTSNAVRLIHEPTGVHVLAGESRSLAENKARALRRLKLRIAAEVRHTIDPRFFEPPAWFSEVKQSGRIAASRGNQHFARAAALLLDLLESRNGVVGDVAKLLGVTTSSVIKFLRNEPELWASANAIRKASGHRPLDEPR